jgi:hypothetical protein
MFPLPRQVDPEPDYFNVSCSFYTFLYHVVLIIVLSYLIPVSDAESETESDVELVNFAFGNYLGSGFYASSGGDVFLLKIPLTTTMRPMTSNDPGWSIRYPLTFGVANVDEIIDGSVPGVDYVGTISIVPGVEYYYPVLRNWHLVPFFDYGFARDLVNNIDIRVLGTGMRSYVTFDFDRHRLTLGNRFLFADQKNLDIDSQSSFAVFETALDYNIPTDFTIHGSFIDVGFYFINYFYLDDLVLVDYLDEAISLENKNEIGFTFSLPEYFWLPDNSRLGLGVQITRDAELYRIVFGMPFF